MQLTVFLLLQQ